MLTTRREFLRQLTGAGLALSTVGCRPLATGKRGASAPNVLFIMVDDLNDWVGCLGGHPQAHTPHIDRFAQQGVLFEQAYSSAPLCNPSRTSLLMGLHPSTTGIYDNDVWFRDVPGYTDWVTLPQYFRQHGYTTLAGGKIFSRLAGKMSDPTSWDMLYHPHMGTPFPSPLERHQNGLPGKSGDAYFSGALDWAGLKNTDKECQDWQTADQAAQFLQSQGETKQPFFLACGIFRPHLPWYAPQAYFDRHPLEQVTLPFFKADDLDDVPPAGKAMAGEAFKIIKEQGQWRAAVQAYLACGSFADACVGHLLQALEKSPHCDNTLVVLMGDHGWHLGQKNHWAQKALWEEANRTPLVFYQPGVSATKGRCKHPVNLLDLHATLIDLCGLPGREDIEGQSLAPLVKKPTKKKWPYPVLTTHGYHNHAVRDQRYRYIRYANGDEELYDHENDPHEWTNLAYQRSFMGVKFGLREWLPRQNAKAATSVIRE